MSFPLYKSHKESGVDWMGPVPAHWEVLRLKDACEVFPSNVDKHAREDEPSVFLCNYTDVYYNERITPGMDFMAATATEEQIQRFTLRGGDTIITKDSETADDIAIAAYVPEDLPGVVCGYHLSMIRPREKTCGAFVKRLFDSIYAKACFAVSANGLTRVGLGQYALDNVKLPFPPPAEQHAIATFLEYETAKIDALVEEQRRLIELLKEKRQAVISRAVTKGLDPSVPMNDSGVEWLGEVPAHWTVTRISNLFADTDERGRDELPVLSVSIHDGVSDDELNEAEMDRKVTRSEDRTKYKRVLPGDLVYNMMRAWQGGFGAVNVEGMVSPAYVVARPKSEFPTWFIERVLRTPNAVEVMRGRSRGVTDFRLRLYWEEFKDIVVPLPPLAEATLIREHVECIENRIVAAMEAAEECIATLNERRSALISAAVKGKIDVRNWQKQEELEAA